MQFYLFLSAQPVNTSIAPSQAFIVRVILTLMTLIITGEAERMKYSKQDK